MAENWLSAAVEASVHGYKTSRKPAMASGGRGIWDTIRSISCAQGWFAHKSNPKEEEDCFLELMKQFQFQGVLNDKLELKTVKQLPSQQVLSLL